MESKQWCYTCLQACPAEDFETGFDCIWGAFGFQSSPGRIKTKNTNTTEPPRANSYKKREMPSAWQKPARQNTSGALSAATTVDQYYLVLQTNVSD